MRKPILPEETNNLDIKIEFTNPTFKRPVFASSSICILDDTLLEKGPEQCVQDVLNDFIADNLRLMFGRRYDDLKKTHG